MTTAPHAFQKSKQMADAIRVLSMDAVQKANSGHPGMPMGMADVATVLASSFLKFHPKDPTWQDRDRLILSAGHGSMLLYALNYLTGYDKMTMDQIRDFRQLNSVCDGHPEYHPALGIEMTTGPLGQGLATSVGIALGERILNARLSDDLVDHYTYVIAGDGCLMEGISQEAISLAGHLGLGKLVVLFDDNEITIDGATSLSTSDDTTARFKASNWHVQSIDGHDHQAIFDAITAAKDHDSQPSLICCRTQIAFGSPNKSGTSNAHGAPLGDDEIAATRESLGWPHPPFEIPENLLTEWRSVWTKNQDTYEAWQNNLNSADETTKSFINGQSRQDQAQATKDALFDLMEKHTKERPKIATRKASGMALDVLKATRTDLIGGSADLTGSNNTKTKVSVDIAPHSFAGNYINYGVREHAMAAAMNGLALHGNLIPYGGTFLVFTDYARPAIRLSALMKQQVIYVMTHDSIGLGEDGPTHQPIEHLASLRAMPNVNVLRPCDAVETAECWMMALEDQSRPTILALSRQSTPTHRHVYAYGENLSSCGGYEIRAEAENEDLSYCLVATGTEVEIALETQKKLEDKGLFGRVVSMPSVEHFLNQDQAYQQATLGQDKTPNIPIFTIEAASTFGWERIASSKAHCFGIDSFGASAPAQELYEHFGLTPSKIADTILKIVNE